MLPVPRRVVPLTSKIDDGFVVPIPTSPRASITKGVESGLTKSSTTNAFPVPSCVILTRSDVVLPEKIPTLNVESQKDIYRKSFTYTFLIFNHICCIIFLTVIGNKPI